MDRLIVNYVHNPLDPDLKRTIREFPVGLSVADIIAEMGRGAVMGTDLNSTVMGTDFKSVPITGVPINGANYVVNIDGMILSERADLASIRPTGCVVICPVFHGGGGGKNILRLVAMIAVMIIAYVYAPPVGAALNASMGLGLTAAQATGIAAMLITTAGSLAVNALIPAAAADLTGIGTGNYSQSPTYGWNVAGNQDNEGVAWPLLHGTHRITPPIIGKYVEVIGDKQWLNLLYAVADHQIDAVKYGIDEDSIEINGNPVTKGEDVDWEIRVGSDDQSCIQYFNDTRAMKSVAMKIGTDWTNVVTDGLSIEGVGIALSLPRGLYYAADDGSLAEQSVGVDIEVRKLPSGDWQRIKAYNTAEFTVTVSRWSGGYWERHHYGNPRWVEIEVGSEVEGAHNEGDAYTPPADYWPDVVVTIDTDAVPQRSAHQWHWLVNAETVRYVGTVELNYCQITGAQSSAIRRTYYRDRLAAGEYEIRARFHDGVAPPDGARYANDVYLEYIEEIIYDDFTYPGTALFALHILATDKYSGSLPAVTMIASRSTVPVWTGEAYENKAADNPAWYCYDMLHNGRYGAGQPVARFDYAAFAAWAAYCTSQGYTINRYSDSIVNLRKALDDAAALGEGAVIQRGGLYTCLIDEEVDLPVQSFIFNAGNTMRESYNEEYLSMADRANCIGVTYWDADKGYKRTAIEIPGPDYDETTQEIKKTDLTLIGCTNRAEAIKHGYRALNRNRLLTKTAAWDVGIDALGCMPWDPVVPPVGRDGRCISGSSNTVKLDREVTLVPGHTYLIRVKNAADDTIEEKTVAAVAEETTTDTLTVTESWTHTPVLHELYVFYEQGQDRGLMRIVRITRKDDHTRRIHAIEYNAGACDDSGTVDAPEVPATANRVDYLRAVEVWKGGAETRAQLTWAGFAILWRVWFMRDGDTAWTLAGETIRPSYEIRGLDYGPEYTFCVSATKNPADGKTVVLTLNGKTAPPGDIDSVTAVPWEDGATFSWAKVTDFDLAGYKARTGVHWQASTDYTGLAGDFYCVPTDGTARRYKLTTPGTSGATEPTWPETGTVEDGTCVWTEDTANWAWEAIADPNYQRALTNDEQIVQGKDQTTLRIWAVARDAFDNVSETPATVSVVCLNQKPYLTVGVTTVEGTFTNLPAAIAKLPSGGGKIIVKNGNYTATTGIGFSGAGGEKHLEIEGETRDGCIVNTAYPYPLLSFISGAQGEYRFSRMTIVQGSTGGAGYPVISLNTVADGCLCGLENIIFTLAGGVYAGETGGVAVNCKDSDCAVDVLRCLSSGGQHFMKCENVSQPNAHAVISMSGCECEGLGDYAVHLSDCLAAITDNKLYTLATGGVKLVNGVKGWEIARNKMTSRSATVASEWVGIDEQGYEAPRLNGNEIYFNTGQVSAVDVQIIGIRTNGVAAETPAGGAASANSISLTALLSGIGSMKGVHILSRSHTQINANGVLLSDSSGERVLSGMVFEKYLTIPAKYNDVNYNKLTNVYASTYTTGIILWAGTENNKGTGNEMYGMTTGISDAGSNNKINKIGGGTF